MSTELICNATGRETRVAVVEDGHVVELHIDRGDDRGFVGNIYLGRVVRVLPGMQAAFVDVGLERAAFLYVGDIEPSVLNLHLSDAPKEPAKAPAPTSEVDDPEEDEVPQVKSKPEGKYPPIQDLLQVGQQLVVQISKDPIGTKGARLTTSLALAGRYLVYMPTVEHLGISRRVDSEKERRRLRKLVDAHRPAGAGFIVRTVCQGRPTETLVQDMKYLTSTWDGILARAKESKAPALLHSEQGLVQRAVRDLADDEVRRIVVDRRDLFDEVRAFVGKLIPELADKVQLYKGVEPVFDVYKVESSLQRSLGRKVWLKSGGYLVIDQTEALMAIDVNSGRFVGNSSLEDTTLQTNLEAVEEVVHQLRLRNMGGIIIIDLIDMEREANRTKVHKALEDALKRDRARTNVLRISDLGLVQMTRKRTQEGLDRYLHEDCPMCGGSGVVRSRSTVCFDIFRSVKRAVSAAKESSEGPVQVRCASGVADLMYGGHFDDLQRVESEIGRSIVIYPVGSYRPEQYEVEVD